MMWLAVAVAGAGGAVCRYVLDHVVSARTGGVFPWGTSLINVSGSLVAGVVVGLAAEALLSPALHLAVAGGFLGAYTTFSTAMYETVRLLEDGETLLGAANLLVPMGASVAAATAGFLIVT